MMTSSDDSSPDLTTVKSWLRSQTCQLKCGYCNSLLLTPQSPWVKIRTMLLAGQWSFVNHHLNSMNWRLCWMNLVTDLALSRLNSGVSSNSRRRDLTRPRYRTDSSPVRLTHLRSEERRVGKECRS